MTSVSPAQSVAERSFGELHAEVQQFYARHTYLLDTGAAREWAETFTEDGILSLPSAPEPIAGRAAIEAGLAEGAAARAAKGEQHRHLLLSPDIEQRSDGSLEVGTYTQVIATPRGGEPRLFLMCVTHDVLVREGRRLLIKHRVVTRDDRR